MLHRLVSAAVILCIVAPTLSQTSHCCYAAERTPDARIETPAHKKWIADLLGSTWEDTSRAEAEADSKFKNRNSSLIGSDWATYSYVLVKINQKKYREAFEASTLREFSELNNASLVMSAAWLATLTKDYSQGLSAVDRLGELTKELPVDSRRDKIVFAGRILGFYMSSLKEKVNADRLKSIESNFKTDLTHSEKDLLEDTYLNVLDRYDAYLEEIEVESDGAKKKAQQEKETNIKKLAEEKTDIEETELETEAKRKEIVDEGQEELDRIIVLNKPIEQQLNRIIAEQQAINNSLRIINTDLFYVNNQLNIIYENDQDVIDNFDPATRLIWERGNLNLSRLLTQNRLLIRQRQSAETSLLHYQARFRSLRAEQQQLERDYLRTKQKYRYSVGSFDSKLSDLAKDAKRNKAMSNRAGGSVRPDQIKLQALNRVANAITTYVKFPTETERLRLLKLSLE